MIKMSVRYFDESVEIEKGRVNIIRIERKDIFREIIFDVMYEELGEKINFFDGNYENFREILPVLDIFDFDANSSKITKIFYENIEKNVINEDLRNIFADKFYNLQSEIDEVLFRETELNIFNEKEFNFRDLLKFYGVKIDLKKSENLKEIFYQILLICRELLPETLVVFINISNYFTSKDFAEISEFVNFNNLRILLIENGVNDFFSKNKNIIINDLDEDMFFSRNEL